MAQAGAQARSREERPHTLDSAVETIGEDPFDPVRWLLLERRALKLAIGLGKGRCTRLLSVAEMPDHAATDDGRKVHFLRQTAAVFFAA